MPYERPAPEYAAQPKPDDGFAALEHMIESAHGRDASGFELLDRNADALRRRLALIDTARYSIDAQYYLWYGDAAGRILMKRLLDAANRGVRVRLLIDDLNSLLRDAGTVMLRDEVIAWVDAHPNMDLRLFNPWSNRNIAGRVGESAVAFKRVNQRMHNKALIIDNRAVILGGRNVGDEYMGLNAIFNFHDLDVLGIGPIARQSSEVFDSYWNSSWVMPVSALGFSMTADEIAAGRTQMLRLLDGDTALSEFSIEPRSWTEDLQALTERLHIGTSTVIADVPSEGGIEMIMLDKIRSLLRSAESDVMIANAYIIPTEHGISILETLNQRGVKTKILTNSLASHDVAAVNSHYRQWRKPILEAGAELYELRHDAEFQTSVTDTPPTEAGFVGLHSKVMLIDGRYSFIGSMNYDPRSAMFNTEMGAIIDSPGLAAEAAGLIERDIQPSNSWQVMLDARGKLVWTNDQQVVTRQPARNFWQRVEDVLFRAIPKQYY
jgi:putative cardiolipin synthase